MWSRRLSLGFISVVVGFLLMPVAFIGGCTKQVDTGEPASLVPPITPVTLGYIWSYDYQLDYGFEYPEDWEMETPEVVDGEDIESVVMFTKPGTQTTIIVTVKLSNLTSLEEVREEFREGFNKLGGTILEEREIAVTGREGYEVIYKPIAAVKIRQVIIIANGKGYILVCSTAEVMYDEYEEIFDHVINSFVIE